MYKHYIHIASGHFSLLYAPEFHLGANSITIRRLENFVTA